jgi:hypothetical protein
MHTIPNATVATRHHNLDVLLENSRYIEYFVDEVRYTPTHCLLADAAFKK